MVTVVLPLGEHAHVRRDHIAMGNLRVFHGRDGGGVQPIPHEEILEQRAHDAQAPVGGEEFVAYFPNPRGQDGIPSRVA